MRTSLFAALALAMVPALAGAVDLDHGKILFNKCRVCHQIGETAKNSVGPILNGIVGRPAASLESFPRYSQAMRDSKLTWDEATLDQYLANPRAVVPGTAMSFVGLPNADDRADLIAWLKQFDASGKQQQAAADPPLKLPSVPTGILSFGVFVPPAKPPAPFHVERPGMSNEPPHSGAWTSF